jgi:hypothetical protein
MMKKNKPKLSLYQPVTYQIKVPGALDEKWLDLNGGITFTVESDDDGLPVTILIGALDQAALQGLLRLLYSRGLPLISVICVDWS